MGKDQGRCGSCWAFSATAAIESYAQLAGKGLKVLSAQQINSCDKRDGGCNGGNTETAYQYVKSAGGIESERDTHTPAVVVLLDLANSNPRRLLSVLVDTTVFLVV